MDQPAPRNRSDVDNPEAWALVIDAFGAQHPRLRRHFYDRDTLGRARYGAPLAVWNGRDAVRDLREELLDSLAYGAQVLHRALDAHSADPGNASAVKLRATLALHLRSTLDMLEALEDWGEAVPKEPTP